MAFSSLAISTTTKSWILPKRYQLQPENIATTIIIVILWIFSYYMMSVLSNIASSRSIDNNVIVYPPLPDVGFHFLPQLDQLWLTDLFDALLVFPTIVHIAFHRKAVHVAHSWFLTSTLCNVERIATVAITSFPDPRAGCEMVTNQIWTKVSAHKCGDCMFSGHTVLFVICACVWTTYPPCNQRIARIVISTIIWLLVLAGSAIVIMNRAHYTVDVLVAWYVGIGNWYIVQYFWKEQTCLTGKHYKPVNSNNGGVFSVWALDEDHERYQTAFEKNPSLRLTLASSNDHSEMAI